MKLLFVTPYLPGPPIFGGQRRMHGLMTHLSASHEVSVLSLVDANADQSQGIADAKSYCHRVVTVPDSHHRVAGRQKRLVQIRSLLSTASYEQRLYRRRVFQKALDRHLGEHRYDVVNCEFVFMAGYRFRVGTGPERMRLTLDEHNVEYDVLRRTASSTSLDRRLFNAVNWRKLRREEVTAWARFDGCTLTSRRDEEFVNREAPRVRTSVIPNGVDLDTFLPDPDISVQPMTVLFFGAINYFPNTDGVSYFLERVLPILRVRHPSLKVRIVGPGAPESIQAQRSHSVEVTGFVEDLRREIARAAVVIAPLRIGGGTRLKIIEAMSVAKPVVSTTIGAEGLDVTHGKNVLLADTPETFANEVTRILENPALGDRLGRAARQLAEERYGWKAAASKLEEFYEQLLASGDKSEPGSARASSAPAMRTVTG